MPNFIIDSADLQEGSVNFHGVVHSLLGLMYYPHDVNARDTYAVSLISKTWRSYAENNEVECSTSIPNTHPNVYQNDPTQIISDANLPRVQGYDRPAPAFSGPFVAGHILLEAFDQYRAIGTDVGLQMCLDRQELKFRKMGSAKGASEKNLKQIWHEFRPISHIAAALIISLHIDDKDVFPFDTVQFVKFIELANDYLSLGNNIGNKRARAPILPHGEGWTISIVPRRSISRTRVKKIAPSPPIRDVLRAC